MTEETPFSIFPDKWRSPTDEELENPVFLAIWEEIKNWDIAVPAQYSGHCLATGNHVLAIMDAIRAARGKMG